MISKELFIKVTGINVSNVTFENSRIYYDDFTAIKKEINIHELAHKCKEWAVVKQYYNIGIRLDYTGYACIIRQNPMTFLNTELVFRANTEPEAVFRAAQWILDNVKTNSIS